MGNGKVNCPICGRFVSKGLAEKYESLKNEKETLEMSNRLMEAELDRVKNANISYSKLIDSLKVELKLLKARGFWARVFNRDCV